MGASSVAVVLAVLTWENCVEIALKNNPDLSAARLSLEADRASYKGSFNGLMPQLSLSNSYGDSSASNAATNRWSASGSLSLDIWNMGNIASIRSASAALDQAQASLRLTSSNLRFDLRQAFAQLLFAQRNLEVSQSIRDMRERGARLVGLRYDSGRESKGNMLRSKAQLLQAEASLSQARRDLRTAQRALERQMGMDQFSAVVATGSLQAQNPPDFPSDIEALMEARPDVALQRASLDSARGSLSRARSVLWPAVSANYSRSRVGLSEFPSDRLSWSWGGTLSIPIFGGGPTAAYYQTSAARRNTERAEEDLRSTRNQARLDLENDWSGFAGSTDQVRVQNALLEAARQRNSEADIRYASGLLSFDNWELIVSDRVNSERQAIQAQLNAVTSEAAWQQSLGIGLGE